MAKYCFQVCFPFLWNGQKGIAWKEESERKISEGSTGKTFLLPAPQCLLGHSAKDIYMISYTQKFENQCPGGKLKYDYQGR